MTLLMFLLALALSGVAGFYAIVGLMAIFAGAPLQIAVMGTVLEGSKLVVASWLYRNWHEAPKALRAYLTAALTVLMILTSIGIFGYLSKAHIEHGQPVAAVSSQLAIIDQQIKDAQQTVDVNRALIAQLDKAVNEVLSRSTSEAGAERAVQIRRAQSRERTQAINAIAISQKTIETLNQQALPLRTQVQTIEAEVGPLKYVASMIYGDNVDSTALEKAVRWMIVLIVIVFDPLAVTMLIAANWSLAREKQAQLPPVDVKSEPPIQSPKIDEPQVQDPVVDQPPQDPELPPEPRAEQEPDQPPSLLEGSEWRSRPPT